MRPYYITVCFKPCGLFWVPVLSVYKQTCTVCHDGWKKPYLLVDNVESAWKMEGPWLSVLSFPRCHRKTAEKPFHRKTAPSSDGWDMLIKISIINIVNKITFSIHWYNRVVDKWLITNVQSKQHRWLNSVHKVRRLFVFFSFFTFSQTSSTCDAARPLRQAVWIICIQ